MTTTAHLSETTGQRLVYAVSEATELLGISRSFAYELVARGELPVILRSSPPPGGKAALLEGAAQCVVNGQMQFLGSTDVAGRRFDPHRGETTERLAFLASHGQDRHGARPGRQEPPGRCSGIAPISR